MILGNLAKTGHIYKRLKTQIRITVSIDRSQHQCWRKLLVEHSIDKSFAELSFGMDFIEHSNFGRSLAEDSRFRRCHAEDMASDLQKP